MQKTNAFAILAPVPEQHLISGLEAIAAQLDAEDLPPDHRPKVAYGSMSFEVFGEVEKLRAGRAVEVFIYASDAQGEQPLNPEVTWRGLYVSVVASRRGRYPGKAIHRPASTAHDTPTWAVFWELQELERLKTPIPIGKLRGHKKKTDYQPRFIPEGPVIIEYPAGTTSKRATPTTDQTTPPTDRVLPSTRSLYRYR
ncbi:hypothetical protein ACQ4M4_18295 [Leptolyngbya sp. AN02str]|uniref:hypothetical protein n=1 Tax=Leptolyngbya sp. AN02str TaxID=3423363 RepID=UPI003D30FEE0